MTRDVHDAAAPAYLGEAAFALWHFSENGSIREFVPHLSATASSREPRVWAVDTRHAPLFWFPRDCPRGCAWSTPHSSRADVAHFFDLAAIPAHADVAATELRPVLRLHAVESAWLQRMRDCRLYRYRLPHAAFRPDPQVRGYWLAEQPIVALECEPVGDLLALHGRAGIELRMLPSLWPWWSQVIRSTLGFSGSRLRNCATPAPDWLIPESMGDRTHA